MSAVCKSKLISRNLFKMWNNGLLITMKDPESIVMETSKLVAFKDKYPKANHHYLVCPHEDIDSVFDLSEQHMELINEMNKLALKVIETRGQQLKNFNIGFHAIPSMSRLHLHVISRDFISPCLKTKAHWNSFNTPFLIPPEKIINSLNDHGKVLIDDEEVTMQLKKDLFCNSCPYKAKNMPDLKNHLLQHRPLYEVTMKL